MAYARGEAHHAYKHGQSRRTPEYTAWANMLKRCTNPKHPQFNDWGGRGIKVCDRWSDFANFYADMGPRPDGMTLERKDNDADYTPDNCRWATRLEQTNNRRTSILVTLDGVTKPVSEWCSEKGMNISTVNKRVRRSGWTWEAALTTPALWSR